jgi:hypothetical protein
LEAPRPHLERTRVHEGGSRTAWCANYWRRRSAQAGGGGGGSQKSPPSRPKLQKQHQSCLLSTLIDLKITENGIFYLKVLNKIYSLIFLGIREFQNFFLLQAL